MSVWVRPAVRVSIRGFAGEEPAIRRKRKERLVQLELKRGDAASRPSVGEEEGEEEKRAGLARCSAGEEIQT